MSYAQATLNNLLEKLARSAICLAAIMAVAAVAMCGCEKSEQPLATKNSAANSPAPAPPDLRLAIVDDSELTKSIASLRGEWKAQTGAELTVTELSTTEISTSKKLDADAIIYPPALLGTLAERQLIQPLNSKWLRDDPLQSADLIQPLDSLEFTWDAQPYAVPLGSPILMLLYRPDLLEQFGKQPPRTWEEYQQLADFFSNPKQLQTLSTSKENAGTPLNLQQPCSGAVEPLASGWAARLLLARAAAYAKHRDYFSVLFDRETMEPLIAGPPFVRALTELVAATKTEPKDVDSLTPADAARWILAGHAALGIGWPAGVVQMSAATVPIAFAQLPGSPTAYNPRHAAWEPRRPDESLSIPLRGIGGHVGSVVRGANSAEAAFRLLAWLSSNRWSSVVLPTDPGATLFRQSQLNDPLDWFGNAVSATAAKQYGQVLQAAWRQPEAVWMPRLPGEAEYVAALDQAVRAAVHGKQTPQQALDETAAQWKQITTRLGLQQQLEAHRRSLKSAQ